HGRPQLRANQWQLAYAYRYQRSDRHFRGDVEEAHRRLEGSEVINEVHLMDFGVTYGVTDRLNLTLSLPLVIAERSQPIRNADRAIVGRNFTNSFGIGDISVLSG